MTFGIKPQLADTGFGYIESGKTIGKGFEVVRFYEKPNLETAEKFICSKQFFWNSGIFCFNLGQFFEELSIHAPQVLEQAVKSWDICSKNLAKDPSKIEIPLLPFKECQSISIDYALME